MGYPRFITSRSNKYINSTDGNLSLASSTWTAVNGSTFDIELGAQNKDVIEYGVNFRLGNESVDTYLDVATVVDGSYVNWFIGDGVSNTGAMAWMGPSAAYGYAGGSLLFELDASDITDDNTVILRLMFKGSSATAKTLYAQSANPLQIWARNIGPQDPN